MLVPIGRKILAWLCRADKHHRGTAPCGDRPKGLVPHGAFCGGEVLGGEVTFRRGVKRPWNALGKVYKQKATLVSGRLFASHAEPFLA